MRTFSPAANYGIRINERSADLRIIESFIRGKYADQSLCEDGIFIGSRIVSVIDGATSHGKLLWNGGRSGQFAKDVQCEYLRLHEGEIAELLAMECMSRLNNALPESVKEIHPELYSDPNALAEYPRASIFSI